MQANALCTRFGDPAAAEIARFGLTALRASAAIFYWVEGPIRMADVELAGMPPQFFNRYAQEMVRFDPLHVEKMEVGRQKVAQLAPSARPRTAEDERYAGFLAEYGFIDVIDLLFWHEGVAVAGLGLLKRRSDPPISAAEIETAFALQRFVEYDLRHHGRIARQHLRQRLMMGYQLTEREAEVAELAATGLTNAGIAARLAITLPTVKTHLLRVLAKTASGNRTQLAALLTQSSI
jgi:DNA-binding CsgD family transcriptional regulator